MASSLMNRHLNIFNFFNGSDAEYLEDNLSRGFALCLKHDSVFLDKILKAVLTENKYSELFNTDYPDYRIEIDLQTRVTDLADYSHIVAVACSGKEIAEFETVAPRDTGNPETDVSIIINDACILFEFKRTSEDCAAQLKCQAEKLKLNCPDATAIEYRDLSWSKIVRILLNASSLEKQIHAENPFTVDFVKFLENFPEWFPTRLLRNVAFPKTGDVSNYYPLNSRLNQIKNQVYGPERTKEIIGRFNRHVIEAKFLWINEVNVEPVTTNGENFIAIRFHVGDTKLQGQSFFRKNPHGLDFPEKILGYTLSAEPYLRFAHRNSSRLWIRPTLEASRKTHNLAFLDAYAGRYKREDWMTIINVIDRTVSGWKNKCFLPNWTASCEWDEVFPNSGRNYFDFSMGTLLTIYLPFAECQKLDGSELDSDLAMRIKAIIEKTRKMIDNS
jgi:hypothetical protein